MRRNSVSLRPLRVSPRPDLSPYVRHIRIVVPQTVRPYLRLPDGELELVVLFGREGPSLHAIGTRLRPLHKDGFEQQQALAVRFKAGAAYPFFGVPVSELTDRITSMDELWGDASASLAATLERADGPGSRVAALQDALRARLSSRALFEPARAASVRRAIRLLERSASLPNVAGLAEQLGASSRQLRRSFGAVTGLGPKEFLRVLRFQRALRSARHASSPDWGALAIQHGYYDQAHLIAEFRALAHATPARWHALASTKTSVALEPQTRGTPCAVDSFVTLHARS